VLLCPSTRYLTGVSQYGQMTAGSFCYIGPQGIVHGTTITIMNASRKYLGSEDMSGTVFVSAGLGGMSGAQAKAALIAGAVGVIAEVDFAALRKRHAQGWVQEIITDLDKLVQRMREARAEKKSLSIGFWGNVVDVWERLAEEEDMLVDLGSDQTCVAARAGVSVLCAGGGGGGGVLGGGGGGGGLCCFGVVRVGHL